MFKEPVIKAGWEYKQTANTDTEATPLRYFRWDLIYYLKFLLQVTSKMDIYRLYFNETIISVPQQDWKINVGFIVNQRAQYCPHLSYDRSAIKFKITYRQEYMNCSKTLVKNLWDVENIWTGKYAKWFEDCSRSQAGKTTSTDP